MKKVVDEILSMLGIPESFEIERKFLIKKPSLQDIESLGYVSKVEIVQTYLIREDPSIERRVRQRGSREDGYTFFYTEKEKKGHATRVEREKKINKEEYISLLSQADVNLHQIRKTRYCLYIIINILKWIFILSLTNMQFWKLNLIKLIQKSICQML